MFLRCMVYSVTIVFLVAVLLLLYMGLVRNIDLGMGHSSLLLLLILLLNNCIVLVIIIIGTVSHILLLLFYAMVFDLRLR